MTPTVICFDHAPYTVSAHGPYGGGYECPGSRETLVERCAKALVHLLCDRRDVKLIGPQWVRDELIARGFTV